MFDQVIANSLIKNLNLDVIADNKYHHQETHILSISKANLVMMINCNEGVAPKLNPRDNATFKSKLFLKKKKLKVCI